jgi:ribosomal protein L37AE/L43A
MSYKHVGTAADLVRYGASLRIECTACGAASTMSGAEVATRCGSGSLERIRTRLKCDRCGMKEAKLAVLPPV